MTPDLIALSQPLETYYCGKCGYEVSDNQSTIISEKVWYLSHTIQISHGRLLVINFF